MKQEKLNIEFGERQFQLRRLNLRQIQEIEGALLRGVERAGGSGQLSAAIEIVRIGLSRDFKEVSDLPDEELEATKDQIITCSSGILEFGGFVPKGEAKAAQTAKNSGAKSMGG